MVRNMNSYMCKVFIVFFLYFLTFAFGLNACTYAYQYSLFPLGSSAGNIIFLEAELERYVNTPGGGQLIFSADPLNKNNIETRWKGTLKLKITSSETGLILLKELSYIDIADDKYNEELSPYFEKAMKIANEQPFFEEAFLQKTAYCAYDRSCTMFSTELDSLEPALYCKSDFNSEKTKIDFPEILVRKFEKITNLDLAEKNESVKASKIDFYRLWKPCSARHYSIGSIELTVYCIGWGQTRTYTQKKHDNWKSNMLPVEQFIEGNDVMMHGQRFDVVKIR
jgi:hypothetical protein